MREREWKRDWVSEGEREWKRKRTGTKRERDKKERNVLLLKKKWERGSERDRDE